MRGKLIESVMAQRLLTKTATTTPPFLVFLHADEEICIAKGRGGGLAVWKKVDKALQGGRGGLRLRPH